ncbi:class I SAM-dependent methyltransferase [Streptomyces sp. L7]
MTTTAPHNPGPSATSTRTPPSRSPPAPPAPSARPTSWPPHWARPRSSPARSSTSAAATARRRPLPHPLLTGHRVIGVDWSQDALARAELTCRTRSVASSRAARCGRPSPTPCCSAEVIEHLVDPDTALAEIRRVLRPGGHLMLSTPKPGRPGTAAPCCSPASSPCSRR